MATSAGRSADVIVVGGGIHGCSTALHLARAGLQVLLLERTMSAGMRRASTPAACGAWGATWPRCRCRTRR